MFTSCMLLLLCFLNTCVCVSADALCPLFKIGQRINSLRLLICMSTEFGEVSKT